MACKEEPLNVSGKNGERSSQLTLHRCNCANSHAARGPQQRLRAAASCELSDDDWDLVGSVESTEAENAAVAMQTPNPKTEEVTASLPIIKVTQCARRLRSGADGA